MAGCCWVSAERLLGSGAALRLAAIAAGTGWLAEELGSSYGWFFGSYTYTAVLGPRLGDVPVVIPLMWFALAYSGHVIANLVVWQDPVDAPAPLRHDVLTSLLGALVVTSYDLAGDPYMVYVLKAWIMAKKDGWWFGETLQGFVGWMTVSFTILFAFRRLARTRPPVATPSAHRVLVPLGVYGFLMVYLALLGDPVETRTIALFAIGVPLFAATLGLLRWCGVLVRTAADTPLPAAASAIDPLVDPLIDPLEEAA
jgi:putative membrane protein